MSDSNFQTLSQLCVAVWLLGLILVSRHSWVMCNSHERVLSTPMNESCQLPWMSHVSLSWMSHVSLSWMSHVSLSWMSHVSLSWMSHVYLSCLGTRASCHGRKTLASCLPPVYLIPPMEMWVGLDSFLMSTWHDARVPKHERYTWLIHESETWPWTWLIPPMNESSPTHIFRHSYNYSLQGGCSLCVCLSLCTLHNYNCIQFIYSTCLHAKERDAVWKVSALIVYTTLREAATYAFYARKVSKDSALIVYTTSYTLHWERQPHNHQTHSKHVNSQKSALSSIQCIPSQ